MAPFASCISSLFWNSIPLPAIILGGGGVRYTVYICIQHLKVCISVWLWCFSGYWLMDKNAFSPSLPPLARALAQTVNSACEQKHNLWAVWIEGNSITQLHCICYCAGAYGQTKHHKPSPWMGVWLEVCTKFNRVCVYCLSMCVCLHALLRLWEGWGLKTHTCRAN